MDTESLLPFVGFIIFFGKCRKWASNMNLSFAVFEGFEFGW